MCGLILAAAASAAPPASRTGILTRATESPLARVSGAIRSQSIPAGRLDLRAPAQLPGGSEYAAFPSLRTATPELGRRGADEPASGLGTQGPPMTEESRAQELARRFHREGLPVARLWETHSALVSLGLNQHGKPGLWLIQKIP